MVVSVAWTLQLTSVPIDSYRGMDPLGWSLMAALVVPLVWRQRYPRVVMWVTFAFWMAMAGLGYEPTPAMLGLFLAVYTVASLAPRTTVIKQCGVLLGIMLAWTAVGIVTIDSIGAYALLMEPLGIAIPLLLGLNDRRRRERVSELEVAHARREQAGYEVAADAVRAERARIARELHDVVAHEMTVMTLQAEGARRRARDASPELTEALVTIAASGRKGLEEMQRMIRVLRASEQEAAERAVVDRALVGGHGAERPPVRDELSPMPSLAALPALARHVREAGLPVTLEVSGSAHVPAGVEVSAYRIIQEALTNAMKHAGPGASAQVIVNRTADAVRISVEDDGRGVGSEGARVSGGHGLAGMAERVQALGGALSHGPRRGGGFEVHAVLPSGDDQVREAAQAAGSEDR